MKSKGMEMPIQIFITLFVLLAVAMLVLQMVSEQFKQQQAKIAQEQQKRQLDQDFQSMRENCASLCANANSDPTLTSKANYCAKSFTNGVDITLDGLKTDYTENLLPGIGICEDRIYCPHIYTCEMGSGQTLTMQKCKDAMCAFWASQSFTTARMNEALNQFVQPGSCYTANPANQKNHWYTLLFDTSKNGVVEPATEVKCQ
ncbi:MAG: hypothetical protein NT067_01140 [Candidatus Diapherotrites archaeon]|nr:hypothetical protein [Candidatus Diapherotrites archaeon]